MNMNNDSIEVYQLRCEGSLGYRLSGTLPKGEFDYQIGQYIDMGVGKFRIQSIEHHQGKCRLYGTFVSEDEMLLTISISAVASTFPCQYSSTAISGVRRP